MYVITIKLFSCFTPQFIFNLEQYIGNHEMCNSSLEQRRKILERLSMQTDLEFPPGIEFLQALHRLLSVHHRRHCGPLLGEGRRQDGAGGRDDGKEEKEKD